MLSIPLIFLKEPDKDSYHKDIKEIANNKRKQNNR